MKAAGFIVTSMLFHVAMIAGIAHDESARPVSSGHPVRVRIVSVEPAAEKKVSPKPAVVPKPKPVPRKSAPVVAKKPETAPLTPAPETAAAEEPAPADPVPAFSPAAADAESSVSTDGSSHAEAAQLVARSFVKPRYTLPARKAHYETEFVAEVLVTRDGQVKDVKFDKEILYEMDVRIIQSIRRASFKPAKNRLGMAIDSWVRIPFRLEMSE